MCDKDTFTLRFVVSRVSRSCVLGGVQIDFSGLESVQRVGVNKGGPIAEGIYLYHRGKTVGCHYLRAMRKIEKLANLETLKTLQNQSPRKSFNAMPVATGPTENRLTKI